MQIKPTESSVASQITNPQVKLDPPNQSDTTSDHHNDDSEKVVLIDPKKIKIGSFPNRDLGAFSDESFEQLQLSIELARKNTVPISVQYLTPPVEGYEYVLVYGQRRLLACQAVGISVRAIISTDETAEQSFFDTVRENLCRANLSPYDTGCQAKFALESNFSSGQNRLALEFGCSKSRISEAIQLASLPLEILKAFDSTSDLQFRHAKRLSDAVKRNLAATITAAEKLSASDETLSTQEIIDILVAASGASVRPSNTPIDMNLENEGNFLGTVSFDKNGNIKIRLESGLREDQQLAFFKHVQKFYKPKPQRSLGKTSTNVEVSK